MISQILKEYSQIRISYEAVGKDPSMEITKILNKLATDIAARNNRVELKQRLENLLDQEFNRFMYLF